MTHNHSIFPFLKTIVNTLSLQKCSGCFRHLSSQCLSCHCTNEQLWSRAEMLLPSAMFCNNSQCEVDNCIKSSINRGGDEIYSTEEQEIQELFPRIDPLKFLKLIDEGAVAVL